MRQRQMRADSMAISDTYRCTFDNEMSTGTMNKYLGRRNSAIGYLDMLELDCSAIKPV
jgi:hypothetical protein